MSVRNHLPSSHPGVPFVQLLNRWIISVAVSPRNLRDSKGASTVWGREGECQLCINATEDLSP